MSATVPPSTDVVKLDLSVGSLHTVLVDGIPHVVVRHAIESLGMSHSRQLKKLKARSWATVAQRATVAEDGKVREMDVVPERTFLMLLATINERNVSEDARPTLIAFQRETADAIAAYWLNGGAINPRATDDQLKALQGELEASRRSIEELAPDAYAWRVLAAAGKDYSVREASFILGRDCNISIGQNDLFKLLRTFGMIDRRKTPYARFKDHLVLRPGTDYRETRTGEIRTGGPQLRVTARGLKYIHRKLGS